MTDKPNQVKLEISYRGKKTSQSCEGSAVRIEGNTPKGKIQFNSILLFTLYKIFTLYIVRIKKQRPNRQKKNGTMKQKTASPGAEPGSSARASNSLTTAPQCHTSFDELILLYHNYFSLP